MLPTNGMRVMGYRLVGHVLPRGTRIGWGTVIACTRLRAGDGVVVGRGNRFTGPFTIDIGDRALIGRHNRFDCGQSSITVDRDRQHDAGQGIEDRQSNPDRGSNTGW